jgi:hypothetical protein
MSSEVCNAQPNPPSAFSLTTNPSGPPVLVRVCVPAPGSKSPDPSNRPDRYTPPPASTARSKLTLELGPPLNPFAQAKPPAEVSLATYAPPPAAAVMV